MNQLKILIRTRNLNEEKQNRQRSNYGLSSQDRVKSLKVEIT